MTSKRNLKKKFVVLHTSCPCGSSSDAYCIRPDGSGYCFGQCGGKNFPPQKEGIDNDLELEYEIDYVPHRGISRRTFQAYGVQAKTIFGEIEEVKFPHGENAAAFRKPDKVDGKYVGRSEGDWQEAGLFGQDIFDPGSKPSITIFEGHYDALAGYEMLRSQSACVSIKNGAQSAFSNLSRQDIYDYVNSFDKIYLCFDNDKAGQDAVKSIQGLFDFRKVYHVKFHKHKDANEYLIAGDFKDFLQTWENAKRFAPDNIISSFMDIEKALNESSEDQIGTYPFPELNDNLYGLHAGEVIVIKAMEGVGKSEMFRAIEHHILKTTSHPIGIIHLEEDNATTIKAIAGYELEVPAVLPDCGLSKKDILSGYRKAVQDDEGRIHIYSSFDIENEEAFLGNIRFLASAAGCRFIFLDHISWLATGLVDEDERKKLDRISQKLKLLAKELRFCLIEISHINDEGKTRGSRNITKVANTVIHLDRDLIAGDTASVFTVEKARLGGRTGPSGKAYFHRDKGKLMNELPKVFSRNPEHSKLPREHDG